MCDLLIFKPVMHINTTKLPGDCTSKEEIRQQIDVIDKEIIALFARRFEYVQAIVKFKKDAESVVAQDRKNEVIQLRGKWAEESGLDKDTFEEIYRLLIDSNIDKEMEILKKMIPQKIMVNSK